MGSSVSQAAAAAPPPPPPPAYAPPPPYAAPPSKPQEEEKAAAEEKVDYMNLPCPVPYEEIQREAFMALKPELFEGLRFDFTKPLNPYFALSHSVFMGSMEIPSQGAEVIKVPTSSYDFGANFLDPKMMLIGRVSHDGRVNARVKCDLTDNLCLKINAQLTNEPHYSQGMFSFDYKGKDFRSQFQIGNNAFYGGNYIQSVTKNLSLGTEAFWLGQQRKSGVGFVARYDNKKMVATGQIASTGMVALSYVQKVSEKVSLASDFMYNHMTKDVTASFGYDYILRQCRLRGKLDTNGLAQTLEHLDKPFICSSQQNVDCPMITGATLDHFLFRVEQVLHHDAQGSIGGPKKRDIGTGHDESNSEFSPMDSDFSSQVNNSANKFSNDNVEGLFDRFKFRKGVGRLCRHPVFQLNRSMKKSGEAGQACI